MRVVRRRGGDGGEVHGRAPGDHPEKPGHAGDQERGAPAVAHGDGGDDQRRDDGAERASAIGHGDAAGMAARWQPVHGGAQAPGKRRALAEAEDRAGHGKAQEAGEHGVRAAGDGPDGDGHGHAEAQADAVEDGAPDGVGQHVGEAEGADDLAVAVRVELQIAEDHGREHGEDLAVHVAEQRAGHHHPHGPPGARGGDAAAGAGRQRRWVWARWWASWGVRRGMIPQPAPARAAHCSEARWRKQRPCEPNRGEHSQEWLCHARQCAGLKAAATKCTADSAEAGV